MTPDFISILMKGQTLVDVPLSDGSLIKVPQWKANGAPSLDAWVRQQASSATPSAPQATGRTQAFSDPDYILPTPKVQRCR